MDSNKKKENSKIKKKGQTKKKEILNPTLSKFSKIWPTCWFRPPNLKSKIFCWSDDRFL